MPDQHLSIHLFLDVFGSPFARWVVGVDSSTDIENNTEPPRPASRMLSNAGRTGPLNGFSSLLC